MDIPSYLETQIREGKVVLFLGAGASRDARDTDGHKLPNGRELGEKLSARFLGGNYGTAPLSQVGELSISESSLTEVQEFIRDIFDPFQPTDAHYILSTFRWRGIATTNYDLLVERAYKKTATAVQTLVPFIENGDRVDDLLRDPKSVPYLKLHGCITRLSNPQCPLILSTDQYIQYREGRSRLFDQLKDWGCEHPIVFIGHSLQDTDIRTILLELTRLGVTRQRYYFVGPDVDDIQFRFWESTYKVTPIKATFDEFVRVLDERLPKTFRGLSAPAGDDGKSLPISERFATTGWTLSAVCKQFLETDVTYVRGITTTDHTAPQQFYRGFSSGWSGIEQNLDVHRRLGDTLLSDHFLAEEADRPDNMEFVLVKAHAGAGKSVLLRRIAWDAAHDYNCLCLYLNPYGVYWPHETGPRL